MAGRARRGAKKSAPPWEAKKEPKMEHLTVQANGAALHVARWAPGGRCCCCMAGPEFWLTWEPVMTRLADRFTLYAPDLRGFGDSDKPRGCSDPTSRPPTCWR
jgi:pimeloyl-ACP methyl ester carboxylesterase